MIMIVYKNGDEIIRIGLYEKATLKFIKWVSKKKYKLLAEIQHIEIKEVEHSV